MADRCQASITIGGILPASLLDTFIDIIENEDLSTEWGGPEFTLADLPVATPLTLMADEVAWGRFARLEEFCVENALPFARWSGACLGAFDAERAVFTGSGDLHYYAMSGDDDVLISRHTAERFGSYDAIIALFDAAEFVVPPLVVTASSGETDNG